VAVALITVLAAIAVPAYQAHIQEAYVAHAQSDIMGIATRINQYITINGTPPPDLATVGYDTLLDPWGRPYAYQSFAGLNGKGKMRKDKNLNPINTQYDLYSLGADGQSVMPLTAKVSQDDVVMAYDGNYIGLASKF
jgi:general secretion pathway protein G